MARLLVNRISSQMSSLNLLSESRDQSRFATYSGAVQYARSKAELEGYEIDEDDWYREITVGPGKPGGDMPITSDVTPSVRHNISLFRNGKKSRKDLHIVISYLEKGNYPYELVSYIL